MPESDASLVRSHLDGDAEAFAGLIFRHATSVYNVCFRLVRNREDAEDLTQEAFLRAHDRLASLRDAAAFRLWLLRIAHHLCLDWLKSRRRGQALDELPDELAGGSELAAAAERAQEAEAVRRAVLDLPPPYREAITLRYNEGLSYAEIAEVMGIPIGTVRTHLFRGKAALRERLTQGGESHE